ncbi:MAG: hypothetical protein ACOC0E_04845 [Spirochaetota bacterium]
MRLSNLGVAVLAAAVVYLSGLLLLSEYSGQAYDRLADHADRLEENVRDLRERHRTLVARAELYRRSSDAVAVEARRLQYYEPGQQVVRVTTDAGRIIRQSPGAILRRPAERQDQRVYARIAAVVAFLLALLVQLMVTVPETRGPHEMRRASR